MLPKTEFIGKILGKTIKTKTDTTIVVVKRKNEGRDYVSEREIIAPKGTKFIVSQENGKKGFVRPSKSYYHASMTLQGNLKQESDETLNWEAYQMCKDDFDKHFEVIQTTKTKKKQVRAKPAHKMSLKRAHA